MQNRAACAAPLRGSDFFNGQFGTGEVASQVASRSLHDNHQNATKSGLPDFKIPEMIDEVRADAARVGTERRAVRAGPDRGQLRNS